jgi:hypothetical protein
MLTIQDLYQQARQLPPNERRRLAVLLLVELEHDQDTPLDLATLWAQLDADPAGWIGERTASEELATTRR